MVFSDWEGFQKLAKKLVKVNNEAILRSAINRSYFAAFQMSVLFAESNYSFVRNRTGEDHIRIINEFRTKRNPIIKKTSRKLDRLRDNRRKADYVETISVTQPLAQLSVDTADKIIQALNTWRPY